MRAPCAIRSYVLIRESERYSRLRTMLVPFNSMSYATSHYNAISGVAFHKHLTAIRCGAACIFVIVALLSVKQVEAQEKAGRVYQLIQQLQSPDNNVRSYAADALGQLGKESKEAVPALSAALHDQDAFVRISAAEALGKIGTEAK